MTARDVFPDLLFPLHSGQIAGLTGRLVIAVAGMAVATLSITGVVIWLRKRASRSTAQTRQRTIAGAGIGEERVSQAADPRCLSSLEFAFLEFDCAMTP